MDNPSYISKPFGPPPVPLEKPAGIRHIIAIISGKGGVGKSTVTANLAVSLLKLGSKVGVLDADLTGHAQSILFNSQTPVSNLRHEAVPADCFGVKIASFGFLYPDAKAVIWRGPMISNGIKSLFTQTKWGEIDYLLVDLPPGTSDAQLTILRDMPITGGIVVTTPDRMAAAVAERGLNMLLELGKRALGVVENMSAGKCEHCGKTNEVFGAGAGKTLSEKHKVALLGQIPLDPEMKKATELRTPVTMLFPDSPNSKIFEEIGKNLIETTQ